MRQIGVTSDGRSVVAGVFELVDTHGVPLEVVVSACRDHGIVVAWDAFIAAARRGGWSDRNTDARSEAACRDVHGRDYADSVMVRVALCRRVYLTPA